MAVINSLGTLEKFISNSDNTENAFYISEIPDVCKEYPCIVGIDEAGRGPVLGPMVYGTSFCPINEQMIYNKLDCADSKELNEEKRDLIFTNICKQNKTVGWAVDIISPNIISNNMLSRKKVSLNQISMDSAVGLIRAVESAGVKIAHVFVDTVGPPEKYQSYLKGLFPQFEITVSKKADSLYPVVSAASICAKVTRDHALKVWKFAEDIEATYENYGSGYPSDPVTKKFMEGHCDPVFGYPQLVRFSWSTAENALEKLAYHIDGENKEPTKKAPPVNNTSITSFFKLANKDNTEKKVPHEFFAQRCLSRDVEF
ncbi:unnamed protein product [Phyllotreta striolata]|uniref:Ribonuclease n=1 Tax=Phyllotreta striolata TaxID=444603 RepID=A0A9N9TTB9_PHYSR|nr:unnamed protein product [Phyllotreta striolata]